MEKQQKSVRIRLFQDNGRYKGDLFVSVNGVNYKIRRGVEVQVPPEVAEVLEHSQMQDERTAARIAGRTSAGTDPAAAPGQPYPGIDFTALAAGSGWNPALSGVCPQQKAGRKDAGGRSGLGRWTSGGGCTAGPRAL